MGLLGFWGIGFRGIGLPLQTIGRRPSSKGDDRPHGFGREKPGASHKTTGITTSRSCRVRGFREFCAFGVPLLKPQYYVGKRGTLSKSLGYSGLRVWAFRQLRGSSGLEKSFGGVPLRAFRRIGFGCRVHGVV